MYWSQFPLRETLITGSIAGIIWIIYTLLSFRKGLPVRVLAFRSGLLAISLLSLCLLIWKPQYPIRQTAGEALLLTENMTEIPDSIPVFALDKVETSAKVRKLHDIAALARNFPEIGQLYVAGYGLEPEQFQHLKHLQVSFIEKNQPTGFQWLAYDHHIEEGEKLQVSGTFKPISKDTIKLWLETAEGIQDSVLLTASNQHFILQARPQLTGNFIGTIRIKQNRTIRNEPLPYTVASKKPLRVLILQDFPAFEINYLKSWLARQKHQVQVRTRISQEKFNNQLLNLATPQTSIFQTLEKADLLITDEGSLKQLSVTERNQLKKAINQGLGLLLLPEESWLQKKEVLGHRIPINFSEIKQFQPLENSSAGMTEKLPATFAKNSYVVPIIQSYKQEVITAFVPEGKGRIGVQLATATFPWLLNGEDKSYNDFWTEVLQAVSRRKEKKEIQLVNLPLLWQQNLSKITVADSSQTMNIRYSSGTTQVIYPKNELPDLSVASYAFRPTVSGWADFYSGGDSSQTEKLYILPSEAWKDLKQAEWWRKNQLYEKKSVPASKQTFTTFRDIPLLWFMLLFLVSAGGLWWHERVA
ncbi:MAG: hypothetical protein H7Y04_11175 [Verrucomicrobia bacterium]|nr:hypothetical protein [Cytophagales bacterium]